MVVMPWSMVVYGNLTASIHVYRKVKVFIRAYRILPALTKQGLVSQVTQLCNVM